MVVEAVADRPANAELGARRIATDAAGSHQVIRPLVPAAIWLADVIRQPLAAGAVVGEQQLAASLGRVPGISADLGAAVVAGDVEPVVRATTTQQDRVVA